jgi:Uma2 family endonuclease
VGAIALVPVEEYLRLTGDPNAEYRDGEVSRKTMPTKLHALIQKILVRMLEAQNPSDQGLDVYPELTVRLSPTKFLVPDVTVTGDFPGPYPTEPVLLCCEIITPEDRIGAMLAKCEEYHAWGVPHCWVIDPVKRTTWQYDRATEPVPLPATGTLRASTFTVALSDLFSSLPR